MRSLMILPVILAIAVQANCGVVRGGAISRLRSPTGIHLTGYGLGGEITFLGRYNSDRYDLTGERSFDTTKFSSETQEIEEPAVADEQEPEIPAAEYEDESEDGLITARKEEAIVDDRTKSRTGSATGTTYSQKTKTVKVPVSQPVPIPVNRRVPVRRVPKPVDVPRRAPIEVPQPVRVEIPRPYPVPVSRPYPVLFRVKVPVQVPTPVRVSIPRPYPVEVATPSPVSVQQTVELEETIPVTEQSEENEFAGETELENETELETENEQENGIDVRNEIREGSRFVGENEEDIATVISRDYPVRYYRVSSDGYNDRYSSRWETKRNYGSSRNYKY